MHNRWMIVALTLGLAALSVSGCQSSTSTFGTGSDGPRTVPVSTISTGSDGLRTFTWSHDVLCDLARAARPVSGVLRGEQHAREPVWIEAPGGRHLSVIWPAGFSIAFSPAAALQDDQGTLVARDGDAITLGQVNLDVATGTFDDPYVAWGTSARTGCYPFVTG